MAESVTVAETALPLAGEVSDTAGGVASGGPPAPAETLMWSKLAVAQTPVCADATDKPMTEQQVRDRLQALGVTA